MLSVPQQFEHDPDLLETTQKARASREIDLAVRPVASRTAMAAQKARVPERQRRLDLKL